MAPQSNFHVGIVGAGLGGLAASIAIARAGASVTVLEAATELGEIGAGIQMFGNVSRFLIRTGVDRIIGENLVPHDEVRNWVSVLPGEKATEQEKFQGKMIGRIFCKDVVKTQGFPWWVVRRDHLHMGLAEGARRHGVNLIVDTRIANVVVKSGKPPGERVEVVTDKGRKFKFDLVIGADGIKSAVRQSILPHLRPKAASKIAAYRAVVPYEVVFRQIPEARSILHNTMDAYTGPGGYVLLYPVSGGTELNVVTAFQQDHYVTSLEDASLEEFQAHYRDFPPFVIKILGLVKETKRWPLLVVPPSDRWSNADRNVVLMGDAAHGMQNHMAQGAATSMEDGIFLGRIISEVIRGTIPMSTGVQLYERKRIPRCWVKQQSAFCMGDMWTSQGSRREARDRSNTAEIEAFGRNPVHLARELSPSYRTTMMFMSPDSIPHVMHYDAEGDADFAVCEYLQDTGTMDLETFVVDKLRDKWASAIWDNGTQYYRGPKLSAKL